MSRKEFMQRLEALLSDLSENEREEALQYYNGYLDDAGSENEEVVLQELGTPEALAASIRQGLKEDGIGNGYFSENGFYEKEPQRERPSSREGGILCVLLFGWLIVKVCPRVFRSAVNMCSRLLHRKGNEKDE